MRQLTFKTYLKEYLRDISGSHSLSLRHLVEESHTNRRITSSLILYCVFEDKIKLFNQLTGSQFQDKIANLSTENFLSEPFQMFDFEKIWNSYLSRLNRTSFETKTKETARKSLLMLLEKLGVSKYRLCKDLKLNPGNINDYFKNGHTEKVSLQTLHVINNYLQDLNRRCESQKE